MVYVKTFGGGGGQRAMSASTWKVSPAEGTGAGSEVRRMRWKTRQAASTPRRPPSISASMTLLSVTTSGLMPCAMSSAQMLTASSARVHWPFCHSTRLALRLQPWRIVLKWYTFGLTPCTHSSRRSSTTR